MTRRYVVFAPGAFAGRGAKTAHGVIAYARDADRRGRRSGARRQARARRAAVPALATRRSSRRVRESLRFEPTALLIGIAPPGGALPPAYRAEIAVALRSRSSRSSTACTRSSTTIAELRALADAHDSRIWDLRMPPAAPLFSGAAYDVDEPRSC